MRDNITASANDHIPWLERRGEAFPFFCDQPVALSGGQWLCLLIAVAVGFGCLTAPLPVLASGWGLTVRALLFPGIPLLALRLVAGPYWTSLFRRLHLRDLGLMLGFAVLNLIVSGVVGLLGEASSPPVVSFGCTDEVSVPGSVSGSALASVSASSAASSTI